MEPVKKISFAFSKTNKKPSILNKPAEKKVDYVVSLEGQSVKLKDEPKELEKAPLVIPLKDNQKDLLDRVRDMKSKQKHSKNGNEPVEDTRPDSELTIEELAAREVVREAKQRLAHTDSTASKDFVVPMKVDELPLEGEKESTLADYENIPVNDFGLAMLRGMGWRDGMGIGKNPSKTASVKAPDLRPKGLGLGASTLVNSETPSQPAIDNNGQALVLKKGCYAKIIAGNNKGTYCEVQGLDDEAGRVVVKTSLKSEILTLSEFMLVPVTKEEYSRSSKVINSAKYEEYKEMEGRQIKQEIKTEYKEKNSTNSVYKQGGSIIKKEEGSDDERRYYSIVKVKPERTSTSSGDEKYSKGSNSKSNSSRDKDRSSRLSRFKHKDSSNSDSDYGKSKRVHKRKDKRRHRDKSRSPNSKSKHNKKSSKSKHRYSSSSDSDYDSRSKSRNGKSSSSSSGSDYDKYKRRNKR